MNAVNFDVGGFVKGHACAAAIDFDNQSARILHVIVVIGQERTGRLRVQVQAPSAALAVEGRAERVAAVGTYEVVFALSDGSADDAVSEFLAADSVIQDRLR